VTTWTSIESNFQPSLVLTLISAVQSEFAVTNQLLLTEAIVVDEEDHSTLLS